MPADRDVAALHDGEQSDLHVIAEVHRLADDDAAETELYAFPDAITQKPAVGEPLERTGEPAEQQQVLQRNAVFRNQRRAHGAGKIKRHDAAVYSRHA